MITKKSQKYELIKIDLRVCDIKKKLSNEKSILRQIHEVKHAIFEFISL